METIPDPNAVQPVPTPDEAKALIEDTVNNPNYVVPQNPGNTTTSFMDTDGRQMCVVYDASGRARKRFVKW